MVIVTLVIAYKAFKPWVMAYFVKLEIEGKKVEKQTREEAETAKKTLVDEVKTDKTDKTDK
jgi:hypothetical protein